MSTYLSRAIRDEIADELGASWESWKRYAEKQPQHPPGAINVGRGHAENEMRRIIRLVKILAPKKIKKGPAQ